MRKTVLFDLDDTLYPELSFVRSGYRATAELLKSEYGFTGDIYEELSALFKESPKRVFNRFFSARDADYNENDIKRLVACYREHRPDISPYPDTMNTLYRLRDMGCVLGIISDGYAPSQKNKLQALFSSWRKLFERVILTDELGKDYNKPDERSFIMMKEFFKTDWNDMVYVGDNPKKDFYIGDRYPILTVRLLKPDGVYKDAPYLDEIKERLRITELSSLPELVRADF